MVKHWTVLLYLAGDNNLEAAGRRDLTELKQVGSNAQLNFVAQFDTMSDRFTRRYYLTARGALDADIVEVLQETNTGDPKTLLEFVRWGLNTYPAEHIALILWNHGLGWKDDDIYARAQAPDADAPRSLVRGIQSRRIGHALFASSIRRALEYPAAVRGILFDDTSKDFLDNLELESVLAQIARERGRKIDLLGFDACLMNMIEIANQVSGSAHYMVGSQEIEPARGWSYDRLAHLLAHAPETTPAQLAAEIVHQYGAYYREHPAPFALTLSALRLDTIAELVARINAWAETLVRLTARRAFVERTLLPTLRAVQKFRDEQYIDLYHFAELIRNTTDDAQLAQNAAAIAEHLTPKGHAAVLANDQVGGATAHAHGISIYFPLLGAVSPAYHDLNFARQTRWATFLESFLQA